MVAGRADLYISNRTVNPSLRRSEGYRADVTKPVFRIREQLGFYLAAGKQVSPALRQKVRDSYEALLAAGEYEKASEAELGQ